MLNKHLFKMGIITVAILLGGCARLQERHQAALMSTKMGLVSFKPTLVVNRQWATSTGVGSFTQYLPLQPALSQGILYTSSATGQIAAVNSINGALLWKRATHVPFLSGVAVGSHYLFVGADTGKLVALSKENGAPVWFGPLSNVALGTPNVDNSQQLVFVKSENDHLYAFTQSAGHLRWSDVQPGEDLILRVNGQPAVADGQVIFGLSNGQLISDRLTDGTPLWQKAVAESRGESTIERMVDVSTSPVVRNGVVYAAAYQGQLVALSLATSQMIWQKPFSTYTSLAVDGRAIYVSDTEGRLVAVDRATGATLWVQDHLRGRNLSGPAVMNIGHGVVVVGDGAGYLHFMSAVDGHFMARVRVNHHAIISTPIVQGSHLFVYASNGLLVGYQV